MRSTILNKFYPALTLTCISFPNIHLFLVADCLRVFVLSGILQAKVLQHECVTIKRTLRKGVLLPAFRVQFHGRNNHEFVICDLHLELEGTSCVRSDWNIDTFIINSWTGKWERNNWRLRYKMEKCELKSYCNDRAMKEFREMQARFHTFCNASGSLLVNFAAFAR